MARCPGCGAEFPEQEGPTHRYVEWRPACWTTYGEVLAREYSDPAYFQVHRLSVDSYAVQHPGHENPQAINSVAVHLIRLSLQLERQLTPEQANSAMVQATLNKGRYHWLEPPLSLGEVTVKEVWKAGNVEEHIAAVRSWAKSAWQAWSIHRATIREWMPRT